MTSTPAPSAAHRCTVLTEDGPVTFVADEGQAVLLDMLRRAGRPLPVGCRGGGCGVCRIKVLEGTYDCRRMSRAHVSAADQAAGVVLACCVIPRSELVVQPAPA